VLGRVWRTCVGEFKFGGVLVLESLVEVIPPQHQENHHGSAKRSKPPRNHHHRATNTTLKNHGKARYCLFLSAQGGMQNGVIIIIIIIIIILENKRSTRPMVLPTVLDCDKDEEMMVSRSLALKARQRRSRHIKKCIIVIGGWTRSLWASILWR
jgi:hypothetical protein